MKILDYIKKGLKKIIDNTTFEKDIRQKASDLRNEDVELSQGTIRQLEDRLFVCPSLWPPVTHRRTIRCL
ncbi:1423_t:CDS:2, partial [Scutellospora calospora]